MTQAAAIRACIPRRDRVAAWVDMTELGAVRKHKDGRVYLDFGRGRRLWSLHVGDTKLAFDDRLARRTLERIRGLLSDGHTLDEALAMFLPTNAPQNLVLARFERWLEVKQAEADAGGLSPTYIKTLRHYAKPEGVLSWWQGQSIHGVSYGALEDWMLWLGKRGLAPKSRKNMLGVFVAFLRWLHRRGDIREMPREIPWPRAPEHRPTVLPADAQDQVLEEIPEERRGIFLAMARLGLRNGEARALDASDFDGEYVTVGWAMKGAKRNAERRAPKNGRWRRLPVPDDLRAWIAGHVPKAARLEARPLFVHPNTGERWAPTAMSREWHEARERAGVPYCKLYEGARHSAATEWKRQGADDRVIQSILGHADKRSVERYARLADGAVLKVLRREEK